ncbi:MAG: tetratricopeptide repeat protein [Candidatus Sulfotelmatobacter sp.]|jgi:tetratricopeptide (TPR) repeat protein
MFATAKFIRARYHRSNSLLLASLLLWLTVGGQSWAQTGQTLGSIIGRVHAERGEAPPDRILVNLDFRGASMNSVFTDAQGTFGFHTLAPNQYTVRIDDEHYQPVEKSAVIENTTMSPIVFVDITLVPKKETPSAPPVASGSNLNMIDARAYSANFPKSALKEFKKGQEADAAGKRDEAIRHYEKAVAVAPDYYFAHNNLGSDYQSKADFPAARKEFLRVVELNQSDAAAYFNLSNVCMLSGQLADAKQYLDEGLRRQPDSALGQFLLGSLNMRVGKIPEAEGALRRAIKIDPFMAQARLQLVNLLLKMGRKLDAASQLRDFIAAFPDNPFTAQAKQSLQRLEAQGKPVADSH